jgi:hypothetical protein
MSRRFRVQHWVACLESQVVPPVAPDNFYDLLRVGYAHKVPADVEMPWTLPRLDMFTRLVGGTGVGDFEIRVFWIDAPEGHRLMDWYGPWRVSFRPGDPTRDMVFRLLNVPIDGLGRYSIRLYALTARKRRLATEYIWLR